jgi:hypothetical protein
LYTRQFILVISSVPDPDFFVRKNLCLSPDPDSTKPGSEIRIQWNLDPKHWTSKRSNLSLNAADLRCHIFAWHGFCVLSGSKITTFID